MTLQKGMVIDVNLDPTLGSETGKIRPCVIVTNNVYNSKLPLIQVVPLTAWNDKKECIVTNVTLVPDQENGLTKKSVADCLQTRPIDHRIRLIGIRGKLSESDIEKINKALIMLFDLNS